MAVKLIKKIFTPTKMLSREISTETRCKYLRTPKPEGNSNRKILLEKEETQKELSVREFEEKMEITYLPNLLFSNEKILKDVFQRCEKKDLDKETKWLGIYHQEEISKGHKAKIEVKWIDRIKEFGLFAAEDIEEKQFIIEYTGIVKPYHKKFDSHNPYCFEYPFYRGEKTPYTIDARDMGNESRYINHSSSPNLMPYIAHCEGVIHLILVSRDKLTKGTELTYDYGPNYWKKREKPREEIR